MDKNRFDGFTRQLAKRENRRTAIKTLFAGGVGTAATVLIGGETDAAKSDCCPAGHPTLCGLTCTDTITDVTNCGACGATCGADQRCYKGVCESTSVVHCAAVSDCPGSDTECSTRTCKKGICGITNAASGKKVTTQIAGDCHKNVCDGAGHVISIVDNTDKPVAQSECTTGICVDGVPHQNMLPSGRKCTKGKCNAVGICVTTGCTGPSTCPGTDTECSTRTCSNGVCGMSFAPADTPVSQQIPGDCMSNVCDGNGHVTSVNDDGDVPIPYQECTISTCANGVASVVPQPFGTACSGGICDGYGACGPLPNCFSDSDCQQSFNECASSACQGGTCIDVYVAYGTPTSSQNPGDCQQNVCDGNGGTTTIADDSDVINWHYPDECVETVCSGGSPTTQNKPQGSSCGSGFCDGSGTCLNCFSDDNCPDTGVPNTVPICSGGYCSYQCIAGYTECIPNGGGCVDTNTDPTYCGSCATACNLPHAVSGCSGGQCTIVACNAGWSDCDGNPANGCETNTGADSQNCGGCNNVCSGGQSCTSGVCQ